MTYDVTIITVRPGTHPHALARLRQHGSAVAAVGELLACWYSELGALNQILLIRSCDDEARLIAQRAAILQSKNPFDLAEFIVGMTMDTYVSFPFMPPITPGGYGPVYEVRTYALKPDRLAKTIELWRGSVPGRNTVSPLLAAMYSVTGPVMRFMHIWPYPSLDERQRLRTKAVADGVWPPPGGPDQLAAQQADIFLPAEFSPLQ
jgi:NIPSNAP protein